MMSDYSFLEEVESRRASAANLRARAVEIRQKAEREACELELRASSEDNCATGILYLCTRRS